MLPNTLDISLVDFAGMHRRLSQAGMPKLKKANDSLTDTLQLARAVQVIRDCGMDQRDELKTLFAMSSAKAYVGRAWDLLQDEIPLLDSLFDDVDEDDNPVQHIEYDLIGFNRFMTDELVETIESPDDKNSLDVFIIFVVVDRDFIAPEAANWKAARDAYRWPEFDPIKGSISENDEALEKAKKYLVEHDSSDLIGAVEVGFFPPYNLFYSPEPEDGSYEPLEFNSENMAFVISEWKQAKPYFEHYNIAREAIENEPERLLVIIEALKAAGIVNPDDCCAAGDDFGEDNNEE